ncbi:TPA: hypothetical protein EYP13_02725, partial [Candidatus Micrarchaeota archaeon]|nr:hypothetical protein [Candidatus Micrarchaeota archaeon]
CKGRLWCGLPRCPVLEQKRRLRMYSPRTKEVHAPTPPAVFVGWKNYPKVEVSPMEALKHWEVAENPREWMNLSIDEIVDIRTALIRPTVSLDVYSAANPPEQLITVQELAMSKRPVEVEAQLEKIPGQRIEFGQVIAPMGPKAPARKIVPQENPKVDRRVENFYYDDVKAEYAVVSLFERGYDVYTLSRILSAGMLGIPKDRKLVPTRWAITAVDDIIYRREIDRIKAYEPIHEFRLYESHRFENHFYIILAPDVWGFELLEAWAPGSAWYAGEKTVIINDWEDYRGRTGYADNVGGSYYAARMAVIEKLLREKRQARAIIIREVHEGYYIPLGVWQVRENVREA